MAGIDDNVAIIGDWVPPSPSPRAFFSAMLGDDSNSSTITEPPGENRTKGLFLGQPEQMTTGNAETKDGARTSGAQLTELGSFSEQKSNSRGGLVERMAARAGFNAPRLNTESIRSAETSLNPEIRSPCLTIPSGLSPTTLLESPVFLSNLAQPSPTTGKFSFFPNGSSKNSTAGSKLPDKSKETFFEDINSSSFAFKPMGESGSLFFLGGTSKVASANFPQQSFPSIDVSVHSENALQSHDVAPTKVQSESRNSLHFPAEFFKLTTEKDNGGNTVADQRTFDTVGGNAEHSSPLDEQQDEEGDQRASGDSMAAGGAGGTPSEDGYNWRKYGQKQVKGSEYPRSYYKCTHPNCSVKKKVERSLEGHITEIIYKGTHIHPKPLPNRRSAVGSLDTQLDIPEQVGPQIGSVNDSAWAGTQKGNAAGTSDWRRDNVEVTSSASGGPGPEFGNPSSSVQAQSGTPFESADAIDASSTFSNDEDDDRATHGSVGYDGEGEESESKRRKIETYATEMSGATRAIREPRVVVQTTSEVDILDDGYRWRKYGQKVVKGNPNPRSYYKCTSAGCTVRKHVERASHDLKSVITTYEGKHNHDVPAARNSSHVNSGTSNATPGQAAVAVQTHVHRHEPSQVHNSMARFERPPAFGSFSLPGRQQLGPSPGFSFGMNQPGLANLAMAGLGQGQPKMPVMPIHPYLAQQHPGNEMGFMMPKEERKVEPVTEPSLNLSNNPTLYQQIMSRLPLGPEEGIVDPGCSGLNVGDTGTEEAATDQSNLVLEERDIGSKGVQFAVETEADMDLVVSPVRQVNFDVVDAVIVSKKPDISSIIGNVEDCFLDTQNNSLVQQGKVDGSHISGVKRKRMAYDEQQPSVHVMYNSLTRASKQKLEELLQQWSEWHAQQNSSHDSDEMLQSGEDTYFPALRVGMEKSSAVSFWIENQARKQEDNDLILLHSNSVPLYDRGYVLGLTSADGPINVEGGLEIVDAAARCFNCGAYNHSLKECPKPRDNAAVNNARKQHKFKRNQNSSSRNPTRYYQSSSGGKYDGLKPGSLDTETRQLLGLGELDPPPWLNRMRELGYPPGYLDPDDGDQPSGITIFDDGDVEEEQEDGEIMETDHPEPPRKMSVEFPGINAPIPENANQRFWEVGPSSSDPFRHRSRHRSNHSSDATGRWHHHEQRQYRDFINDGPPGVDPVFSPSMSSYPPRYGHHDSSYSSDSPRDLSPAFGRSNSDRGRGALVYEDFASHGSSSYSSSRKRSSPQDIGSARYETDNSRDDYDTDYSYRDYSFRSEYDNDRYRRRSRR